MGSMEMVPAEQVEVAVVGAGTSVDLMLIYTLSVC
jgi:hypothetical protein